MTAALNTKTTGPARKAAPAKATPAKAPAQEGTREGPRACGPQAQVAVGRAQDGQQAG